MRILIILLFSYSTILAEQNMSDKELFSKINGIWSATYNDKDYSSYSESLYSKNSTFITRGERCVEKKCETFESTATYEIKDHHLI